MDPGRLQPLGKIEVAEVIFGLHSNYPKPILWIQDAYPMFLSRREPTFQLFIRYQKRWPKGLPMRVGDEPKVQWNGSNFSIHAAYKHRGVQTRATTRTKQKTAATGTTGATEQMNNHSGT